MICDGYRPAGLTSTLSQSLAGDLLVPRAEPPRISERNEVSADPVAVELINRLHHLFNPTAMVSLGGIEGLENKIQQFDHILCEQIGRNAVVTGRKIREVRYFLAWDESKVRDRGE